MTELTLESLAHRIEEVERQLNEQPPSVGSPIKEMAKTLRAKTSALKR